MSEPDRPLRDVTSDEIAAYEADGIVCLRGILQDEWIDFMRAAIDRVVEDPPPVIELFSRAEEGYTGGIFLWKQDEAFHRYLYHAPLSRIAMQAMKARHANCFFDQIFVKQPGCLVPTPWHQDLPYWPITGNQICSTWVPFDPVTKESSGLEFIRGSHKWPQNFKPQAITKGAIDADESDFDEMPDIEGHRGDYDIVAWDMEPGDVLLFHGRIVHGAGGNATLDVKRRSFTTRWAGEDIRWDPRPGTLRLLYDSGLEPGEPLHGPVFPQIAPQSDDADRPDRFEGPESPPEEKLDEIRKRQQEAAG